MSTTTMIHFDGFVGLPAERSVLFSSPKFTCLGNEWQLDICPGGDARADEGMVSIFLFNMSNKSVNIKYGFSAKDCADKNMKPCILKPIGEDGNSWGTPNFAERSQIMDSLVDGALVIEVYMKLVDPTKIPPPFIPENPSVCKIIQDMFMDEEFSDIVFEVGGQRSTSNVKMKTKTSSATFPAHRLILGQCSSIFADLCKSTGDKTAPIQISNVSPDVFHHMLFHMYGGKVADEDMKSHAKEIIDAADKYGVVDLKLAAEAFLFRTTASSTDNLLDLLLCAHSKNCALLKEAALDFMIENRDEAITNISFKDAPGPLAKDILVALARGEKKDGADGDSVKALRSMRISELRLKAHKNGLNVDRSREMLIALLEGKC